ncbi:hypothetical protein GZH46_01720 [Fragariocoptes setiger]|uniref:Uncharacterized protein n=1 Tax=Fragariocoptes setiger TaxID=1670756 RepID=A0ABQ7S8K6_9ACAR|nr:hypothetical protein GZH46_01720 [Fragariocoptes setiger]
MDRMKLRIDQVCIARSEGQLADNKASNQVKSNRVKVPLRRLLYSKNHQHMLILLLFALITITTLITPACGSRKFLTGLIIGTLMARQGLQQPTYVSSEGTGNYGSPQPLLIIIPSTSATTSGQHHNYHHPSQEPYHAERSMESSSNYPIAESIEDNLKKVTTSTLPNVVTRPFQRRLSLIFKRMAVRINPLKHGQSSDAKKVNSSSLQQQQSSL